MSFLVQESFDRIAKVSVFQRLVAPGLNGPMLLPVDPIGYTFKSRDSDGLPGFRISFRIEKVKEFTPGPVSISLYNLGPLSRAVFRKDNLVTVQAGYGDNAGLIFKGTILRVRTRKQNTDYVTEVEAGDGIFATQNSYVDLSFKTAMPAQAVLASLVGVMQTAGVSQGQILAPTALPYASGLVVSGRTVDRIKEVCEKNNLEFSIQDGMVYILPRGIPKIALPVILATGNSPGVANTMPNTGLIGIPEIRETGSLTEPSRISLKSLLNYNIGVFSPLTVFSKFVNGPFTALKVVHIGDTWTGPWYTEIEASGPGLEL